MTHLFSQLVNWHHCNAGWTRYQELDAVATEVMEGWDSFECLANTARLGLAPVDRQAIKDLLEEYSWLSVTVAEVTEYILHYCKERVED